MTSGPDSSARAASSLTVGTSVVEFTYVDVHPTRQVVRAVVPHGTDHGRYTVGHLPSEGWFCTCRKGKACPRITEVRRLVPGIDRQHDAAGGA